MRECTHRLCALSVLEVLLPLSVLAPSPVYPAEAEPNLLLLLFAACADIIKRVEGSSTQHSSRNTHGDTGLKAHHRQSQAVLWCAAFEPIYLCACSRGGERAAADATCLSTRTMALNLTQQRGSAHAFGRSTQPPRRVAALTKCRVSTMEKVGRVPACRAGGARANETANGARGAGRLDSRAA